MSKYYTIISMQQIDHSTALYFNSFFDRFLFRNFICKMQLLVILWSDKRSLSFFFVVASIFFFLLSKEKYFEKTENNVMSRLKRKE